MGQLAILHPTHMTSSSPPTTMNPNLTRPPKGILKKTTNNRNTEMTSKNNLVMGQVKILKRGESLNTVLKEVNHHHPATTTTSDNKKPNRKVVIGVLPPKNKKKTENLSTKLQPSKVKTENLRPKLEASKEEEEVLCSTNRLGPDPEIVSKDMKKKVLDCFAGSAFSDSPPPSSVPLPGFFRKRSDKDDATMNLRRILGLSLV